MQGVDGGGEIWWVPKTACLSTKSGSTALNLLEFEL